MSGTIVRNVVIKTSIEADRTRAEGGGASGSLRRSGDQVSDLKRIREQLRQNEEAHERHGRAVFKASLHGLHGFTSFAKGIALMSGSSEESIENLARKFVYLEGVVSTVKGGMKLMQFASEFGAVGMAITGVGAAVAAGAVIWNDYTTTLQRVKDELKQLREEGRRLRMEEQERQSGARKRGTTSTGELEGMLSSNEANIQNQINIEKFGREAAAAGTKAQGLAEKSGEAAARAAQAEGHAIQLPSSRADYLKRGSVAQWGLTKYRDLAKQREKFLEKQREEQEGALDLKTQQEQALGEQITSTEALQSAQMRRREIQRRSFDKERETAEKTGLDASNAKFGFLKASDYIANYGTPDEAGKRRKEVETWLAQASQGKTSAGEQQFGKLTDLEGEAPKTFKKQALDKIDADQQKFEASMDDFFKKNIQMLNDYKKELDKVHADVSEMRTALGKEGK